MEKVKEHGWFRTGIPADDKEPGFSFTTGFWVNTDHPELMLFGLKDSIAHDILWSLFRDATAGRKLVAGERTDSVFANLPAYAFAVSKRHYVDYLGWSRWFYRGDDFPCLQIVWPDRAGVFPWEEGFDVEFEGDQPDLTERGWINELVD